MAVYLYTAPASEPLTLAEVHKQLNLEHALDDVFLTGLISAARTHLEKECWRGFVTQTWEMVLSAFPADGNLPIERQGIELKKGNLVSVTSVKYIDEAGVQQTLAVNTDYVVDTVNLPGRVRRAYGVSWPGHRLQWDAVRIQYVVGWSVANVPTPLKQAMLMLVSQMYEIRTPEVEKALSVVGFAVDALSRPYRMVRHT